MKVDVRFFATLREVTNTAQTTVDVGGSTVSDVIDALVIQYGDRFRQEILQPDGNIRQNVKVLLNGLNIDRIAPLQNVVKKGDTLYIFPPLVGG